jgi:hypothetical protein
MGGSSGAMMTNGMAGSYPDIFEAGAAFSGTAHACFAGALSATPMSPNQTCAQGQIQHTAQEWGNFVRNSYPGYAGLVSLGPCTNTQMSQAAWSDRDQIQSILFACRTRAWEYLVRISLDTRIYLDVNDEFDRLEIRNDNQH